MVIPKFQTSLFDPRPLFLNSPLFSKLSFSLTNVSENDWYILKWFTPLEAHDGVLYSNCLKVTCDNEIVDYIGIMMKRGKPTPECYVLIKAAETIVSDIVMSSYDLSKPGKYFVELDCSIIDYVLAENKNDLLQKDREVVEDIPLVCEPCCIFDDIENFEKLPLS